MMARQVWMVLLLVALIAGLAACGEENTAPVGDPPVLGGFDSMPKQLATLALTATPTPVVAGEGAVAVMQPTPTPGPVRPTVTLTPYVGVFVGEPTSESGEPPPTLAPWTINAGVGVPVPGGGGVVSAPGACSIPVASAFGNAASANATVPARLGCPVSGGANLTLVTQRFERGQMFWRDTHQIYALADGGQFWQVSDNWREGMAADDPGLTPPGGLIQPVRGFGLAWRGNPAIREALGWATGMEAPYTGYWQDFEQGAMFTGPTGQLYAVFPAEGQHSGPLSR